MVGGCIVQGVTEPLKCKGRIKMFSFLRGTKFVKHEPLDKLEKQIEELMEENRKLSGSLSLAMGEASRYREPVRVHLEIDFKNFKERKKRR
jgi:hypothetical protein